MVHKMHPVFLLCFEMAQSSRLLQLFRTACFDAHYLQCPLRQTVCWRRRVMVLIFQPLCPLIRCPRGGRRTRHCAATSLSHGIIHPLCNSQASSLLSFWEEGVHRLLSAGSSPHRQPALHSGADCSCPLPLFGCVIFINHYSEEVGV